MVKRRYSSDDDSEAELDIQTAQGNQTKRNRIYNSNGTNASVNEEYMLSQGKCSFCGNNTPPTYYCLKCQQLFHSYCGNFRVENDKAGICGNCLISIILECPCCHQRGFKGIHGLRTHIGGYCKKQHAKDWRQHFKEFFAQLTQRLDSVPNRDISALSIIRSHRQMANAVAKFYGCADDSYYKDTEGNDSDKMTLMDYITQVQKGENARLRKSARYNDGRESLLQNTQSNAVSTVQHTPSATSSASTEEISSNYNLRRKSSLPPANNNTQITDESVPQTLSTQVLEKNNPLNTVLLDCPFCEKAGCQGLPGIRTHIRNYCPSVDKSIWREKLVKCVKYNIKKYEDMNKLPNANTEYNEQVINLLKAKSTLDSDGVSGKSKNGLAKNSTKQELSLSLGTMNVMSYEKVYCEHCHDENSYCPFCGCHTCHYKHIAPLLLICDNCNQEHHLYCISPPLESIPDGSWYCPTCQKKNHIKATYEDANFSFSFKSLSEQAADAVNMCLPFIRSEESEYKASLSSLSMADLLQVQSYYLACSNRLFYKLH